MKLVCWILHCCPLRQDEEAKKYLEDGDEALHEGDLDAAMKLYLKAQAIDHENPKLKSRVKHTREQHDRPRRRTLTTCIFVNSVVEDYTELIIFPFALLGLSCRMLNQNSNAGQQKNIAVHLAKQIELYDQEHLEMDDAAVKIQAIHRGKQSRKT